MSSKFKSSNHSDGAGVPSSVRSQGRRAVSRSARKERRARLGRLVAGVAGVALVAAGCADTSGEGDAGVALADLRVAHDFATHPPDLAMSGADGGAGSCLHYDTWPGLSPQGGYDDTNVVTYAGSVDTMGTPANALTVQDFAAMGETYPKMVTYSSSDTYSQCDVCTIVAICDANGCNDTYFAQAGTVTVTKADRNAAAGEMVATASNLTLVEWDFSMTGDKAVPNGRCITVGSATFDVKWNHAPDGGVPDLGAPDLGAPDLGAPDLGAPDLAMAPVDLRGADLKATSDLAVATGDMAKPPGDMARPAADLAGACHPVINELQTTGASASDEWVEIANPCNGIDFTGWKLAYRSAANNNGRSDTTLYNFTANVTGKYVLIVGQGYTGTATPDGQWLAGGLAGAGGAVALVDPNGAIIDSVSYQTLTAPNAFTEGSGPAPNPPANESIARTPDGTDTDDNAKDFQIATKPTPKAAN